MNLTEDQKKEFTKMFGEMFEKQVRELGLDKAQRKEIVVPGKDAVTLEAKEKVGKFFKAFASGDIETLKSMSEGTDADGGYLVPNEFRAMVLEKLHLIPNIRKYVTVYPMKRDTLEVPAEGNAVTVQWGTESEDMGEHESNPTLAQVKLVANILFGYSAMSRQLASDSPIVVADILSGAYARAFAKAEAAGFIAGTGSGQMKGLRAYTISQAVAQVGSTLANTDVDALYFKLPSQYRANARFFMNNAAIQKVYALQDSNGVKYFPDVIKGTLLGRPVEEMNDIPSNLGTGEDTTEIYFGDPAFYLMGDRESLALESTTVGGTAFKTHKVEVKGYERLDGQLGFTEAFAKLTGVK